MEEKGGNFHSLKGSLHIYSNVEMGLVTIIHSKVKYVKKKFGCLVLHCCGVVWIFTFTNWIILFINCLELYPNTEIS